MKPVLRAARRAFTLIELLVAMSIIVVLTSLVLLVMTNINERDGTTDAAGLTRQWLMISKARASRDNAPRGIRLVTGLDPNNPAKTSPSFVTEFQYIEAPPILITYPAFNGDQVPTGTLTDPAVIFTYTLSTVALPGPPPVFVGSIIGRQCQIVNLRGSDAVQIVPNSLLQLPVLGSWHRVTSVISIAPQPVAGSPSPFTTTPGMFTVNVNLDSFPDSQLGAAGVPQPQPQPGAGAAAPCYTTQHFGISAPPRPLLGEPPLQLPKNICVDVTPFTPPANPPFVLPPCDRVQGTVGQDIDILFTPNGHVLPIGAGAQADGAIYLWHRDYTKLRNAPNGNNPLVVTNVGPGPTFTRTYDLSQFQNGGEQQLVAIRCKSGSLGQFPVLWPNAGGQYTTGEDPYTLARQGATSP